MLFRSGFWSSIQGNGACGLGVGSSEITSNQDCSSANFEYVDPNPDSNNCISLDVAFCAKPDCSGDKGTACGDCNLDHAKVGYCFSGSSFRVSLTLSGGGCTADLNSPQSCNSGCTFFPWSGYQCINPSTGQVCNSVAGGIGKRIDPGSHCSCSGFANVWVCHIHFDEIVTAATQILTNCCCPQ